MKKLIALAAAALLSGQTNAQVVTCPGLHVCIPDTTSSSCLNAAAAATGGVGSWSSSNSSIATVSSTGQITGVGSGYATISYVVVYTAVVSVNPTPVANPYYDTLVCSGGDLKLYAGDAGEAPSNTYAWTGPNSFSATARNPVITGATTSANGIYSLTVTSAAGCASTYTLSASVHSSSFYSVSVNQTAPFTLVGQRVHTRTSSAFTLQAVTTPALPSAGRTYTWAGYVPGSAEYFAPTSGFPTSSVVGVYPYTVTVTYNGCSASVPDTIIVPPSTECPPETYFTVNRYREAKGLDTLTAAVCSDCSTVQPFVTIIGNRLTTANIGRKTNYYIVGPEVKCDMDLLDSNVFYMAKGSRIIIDSNKSTTINHCHFFACTEWAGIIVKHGTTTSGHVNIINNTLIENGITNYNSGDVTEVSAVRAARTGGGSSYYVAGMADIINSDGVIYNKNGFSIFINDYRPSVANATPDTRLPFTIKNNVFINKELASKDNASLSANNYPFSWPTTNSLKTVVKTGAIPMYNTSTYKGAGNNGRAVRLLKVGTSSQYTAGDSNTPATYGYNHILIGCTTSDVGYDSTNLCDSISCFVQSESSNVIFQNNTTRLNGLWGIYVSNPAGYNNSIRIEGDTSAHTNNRVYGCATGISFNGAIPKDTWDITCKNTVVVGEGAAGADAQGIFGAFNGGHNRYDIRNNYISNMAYYGISIGFAGIPSLPKGTTNIIANTIVGKSTPSGSQSMTYGIWLSDNSEYGASAANGIETIDSNRITGARHGVFAQGTSQKIYINDNVVSVYSYSPSAAYGIYTSNSIGLKEIKNNLVSGVGYNCTNGTAYLTDSVGNTGDKTKISCNLAMDINAGFEFKRGNFVQWTKNEMKRCGTGMNLITPSYTTIGQQGDVCEPTDNRWTTGSCEEAASCSGCGTFPGWTGSSDVKAIRNDGNADLSLSIIYLRNTTNWAPPSVGGSPVYSFASGTLVDASSGCGSMPDTVYCGPGSEAGRAAVATPAIGGSNTMVSRFRSSMSLFPNPTDGTVTVAITDVADGPVKVRVMNALGAEVYSGNHTFANGQTDVNLQRMVPGIYTVQLTGSNGSVNTGKVVLVK